ncbi:MAG: hypothetical protein R3B96_08385 [Pirellulaceae bacterium]
MSCCVGNACLRAGWLPRAFRHCLPRSFQIGDRVFPSERLVADRRDGAEGVGRASVGSAAPLDDHGSPLDWPLDEFDAPRVALASAHVTGSVALAAAGATSFRVEIQGSGARHRTATHAKGIGIPQVHQGNVANLGPGAE